MNTAWTTFARTCLALFALAQICAGAGAQEGAVVDPQKPAASAPSISGMFKGLRDRLGGGKGAAAAPASAAGTTPDAASASPATPAAPNANAVKIKEFKPAERAGSKMGAQWNDTHCHNLVEPFGFTDSLVSISVLKGRKVADNAMNVILGKATASNPRADRAEIREDARQLNWLPMPIEQQIGQKIHDGQTDLLREDRATNKATYARARRILAEVTASVKEDNPYVFRIFVTNRREGNAEAAPGGWIYVDQDLVDKASEEPRARFTIAHEVSHVLQRHRTRETQMRLSDGVDSLESLAKLIESTRNNGGDAMLKTALDTKRMFVRHSEEQELQADGCAVRLLDTMTANRAEMIKSINAFAASLPKAGPPEPQKRVTTEAVFGELSNGEFSRHPNSQQRIDNLKAVVNELGKLK